MKFLLKYLFIICLFLLLGCSRITQANFDKIQPGMSMTEVIHFLGEPTSSDSINIGGLSGTAATWKDKNSIITIQFLNDTVQIKSFSHADKSSSDDTQNINNS
jgi:hypothetical protein